MIPTRSTRRLHGERHPGRLVHPRRRRHDHLHVRRQSGDDAGTSDDGDRRHRDRSRRPAGSPSSASRADFRYDAVLLEVVATSPPTPGGRVHDPRARSPWCSTSTSRSTRLRCDVSDLILSGLRGAYVSDVTVVGRRPHRHVEISGITNEAVLSAEAAAGAIHGRVFGNPSAAFSGTYIVDYGTTAYPVPLVAVESPGLVDLRPRSDRHSSPRRRHRQLHHLHRPGPDPEPDARHERPSCGGRFAWWTPAARRSPT